MIAGVLMAAVTTPKKTIALKVGFASGVGYLACQNNASKNMFVAITIIKIINLCALLRHSTIRNIRRKKNQSVPCNETETVIVITVITIIHLPANHSTVRKIDGQDWMLPFHAFHKQSVPRSFRHGVT